MPKQSKNPNQIGNPKSPTIEQPKAGKHKTPQMNDRDRINDVLAMEKYLTDSFNVAAREASHEELHRDMMTILMETHQCQRDLYLTMFRQGVYKVEAEEQQKLDQTYKQFSNYTSQFPYGVPLQ